MLKRRIWGIYRETLEMILEVAKSSDPNEFVALMHHEGGIIDEIHFLPGSTAGEDNATLFLHMRPIDLNIVGSVHSHPSGGPRPSEADRDLFRRFGHTHIIVAYPYTMQSWKAFDLDGNKVELEVVDE
ncbi:MAG TPA: Mov34/MPN/PAD-1 family protein [Methanomassiliicoccales archaeon]|nr:Mov34/MPN/PAD-1 family protein [Methanomassiliicoccales archaeon]